MITTTLQIDQVDRVKTEIASLLTNKEAIAKIINYDSFGRLDIKPTDIQEIQIKGDILRFLLTNNRATMLSVSQLFHYWEKIKMNTPEPSTETELPTTEKIVELAKEFGTAVWEHGTKLGYIIQYRKDFFAVTEVLTATGFKYSHSLHGSFYLAHSELIERSWEVEAA